MGATIAQQVDSRKEKLGRTQALQLARNASHLWVARGKIAKHIDLKKDKPTDQELAKLILGPTGTLRAPTIRRGKTLFVGFNEAEFAELLS